MKKILLILCMALPSLFVLGQSPGGVAAPDFWVKSDDAGTIATAWKDHSANADNIPNVGNVTLAPADRAHNFHPYTTGYSAAKYFNNTNTVLNTTNVFTDPSMRSSVSVFSAVRPTSANGTGRITGIDDDNLLAAEPGVSINSGIPYVYKYYGNGAAQPNNNTMSAANAFTVNKSSVFSVIQDQTLNSGRGERRLGLDGTYENFNLGATTNTFNVLGKRLMVGYGTYDLSGAFPGDIMEVVWYKRGLTPNEQSRVNSYLAVKNGTTLNENYLSTNSTVVWDRTLNAGYNSNIFGIAKDDMTVLHQKQAGSVNSGQKLVISTTGFADSNAANSIGITSNQQYLMIGDNGLEQKLKIPLVYTAGSNGATNSRFESIWKIQNSGGVGTVTVAWPKGVKNLYLIQSSDAIFDTTADTYTPMTTEITVNGVVYNTANVTLADGQFFTFAGSAPAPGGVLGPDFWVKSDDAGTIATAWKDHSANADNIANVGNVTLAPADRAHNFYPYTTGYSASKYFRNNNSVLNTTNVFTDPSMRSSVSVFSAVRPTSANGTGRITGIDDSDLLAVEPSVSINGGLPYLYKYYGNGAVQANSNTMSAANAFTTNRSSVFSAIQDQALNSGRGERRLGLDGIYESFNLGAATNTFNVLGKVLMVGYGGWDATGAFPGEIMEVLWYKRALTPSEQSRVNSYLAVKNGTTLNENYLSTNSTVVWDRTLNAGYNSNIFGIAKDDMTLLHQKQAGSVNNQQKLVISTTGLADSNAANPTGIATDLQYLMIGDNGLEQKLAIPLSYTAGSNGATNYRFESIWKVQNTNSVGQVTVAWPKGVNNLYLVQSTDATFASGNTFTPMTAEVTVNGVVYNTATVTLGDAQFFTFAGFEYAPGGVSAAAWYRADAANTLFSDAGTTAITNSATIQQWNEFNNKPFPLSQSTATYRPQFSNTATLVNFNPTVTYDGTQKWLQYAPADAQGYILNRSKGALFSAGSTTSATASLFGFGAVGSGNAMDDPGLYSFTGNKFLFYPIIGEYDPQSTYTINGTYIGGGTWENGAGIGGNNAVNITLGGYHQTYNTNISNVNTATDRNALMIGKADAGAQLVGQQNEMIVFANKLTDIEVNKVESYLAVKYGETLSKEQNRNYVNAIGTLTWDGTNNNAYYNNIVGIGREDISALHQKQSKSVNANQKLIIGVGGTLANTNALNTNTFTEGQFLIVGDNGLRQVLSVPISGITGINYRFESIWKTQNTGNVGTVRVAWPVGLNSIRLIQSPDAVFDGSDIVTDMSANTQTVNGVTYNYADVTFTSNQYFTFAALAQAPGGVIGEAVWLRADKDITVNAGKVDAWTNQGYSAGNAVPANPANGKSNFVSTGHNFNPVVVDNTTAVHDGLILPNVFADNKQRALSSFVVQSQPTVSAARTMISYGDNLISASSLDNPWFATTNATSLNVFWQSNGGALSQIFPNSLTRYDNIQTINSYFIPQYTGAVNTSLANSIGMNGSRTSFNRNGNANSPMGYHLYVHQDGGNNNTSEGSISEVISYDMQLSANEQQRIDSYLAIKYGITLFTAAGTAKPDYLDTASGVVWNASANTTYNNNIFGVAKDDIEAFEQKVSKSVNAGTILTLATTNDFVNPNLNASRTGFTTDKTYFLLGDNNNVTTTPVDVTIGANTYKRIPRIWMAQEKDADAGSLFFEADLTAYNSGTFVTTSGKMIMLVADDAAFTTNVIKVNPTSNALAKWVFNQNVADGKFITFAADPCYGPDTDGDGVADMCDQDNDNDGILNTNEGYICGKASIPTSVLTTDHVMNYNFVDYNGIKGFNFKLTSTAVAQRWASPAAQFDMSGIDPRVTNNKVTYEFDLPVDNLKFWVGDLDALEKVDINFYDQNGTRITDLIPYTMVKAEAAAGSTTFTTDATYGVKISTTRFSGANGNVNYVEISTPGIQISKIEATFVGTNGNTPEYHIGNMCAKRDLDGDRIPDYLDLDSDGDGCPDAIEGTGHFTSANLVSSSLPGGNSGVGYTGTSSSPVSQNLGNTVDANGIPVIANGGQGIGYSQSSYVNACIDTDNDGNPDIIDLDNDNDGITNLDENCGGYYAQNVSGTWKGNTTSNLTVTAPSTGLQAAPGFNDNLNRFYVDSNGATQRIFRSHTNNSVSLTYNFSPGVPANELAFYIEDVDGLSNGSASASFSLKINGGDVNGWMIKDMTTNYISSLPSAAMNYDPVTGAVSSLGSVDDQWLLLRGVGNNLVTSVTLTSNNFGTNDAVAYSLFGRKTCDTDGDGIPNYLDLDSDGDGCPDSIEGAGGFTTANLVTSSMPGGNSGAGYTGTAGPVTQNLGNTVGNTATTLGIPTIAGTGQTIGSSANASVSNCIPPFCYKPGITVGTALDTKVGITALSRAGADNADNWPMVRKGGWLALESKTKGFVPNKVAFSGGNPVGIAPADFVEGMMVYDDTNKCMKIYTQKEGDPSMAWHCITTQTCPD